MPTTYILRIALFIISLLFIDWYFFRAILALAQKRHPKNRKIIVISYWSFTCLSFLTLLSPFFFSQALLPKAIIIYVIAFVVIIFISKLIGSVVVLLNDMARLVRWLNRLMIKSKASVEISPNTLSRFQFLNYMALGIAAMPFLSLIYGMIKGAFNYKIHNVRLTLPNLPTAFNGLKIVQISDIHVGSFISNQPLEEAVNIIMAQNADVIFFTGDLVNDRTSEVDPFMNTLNKIKAPLGVFSILGNHDYGDYVTWDTKELKEKNMQDMLNAHKKLGWKLLINEHISLKKEDAEIAIMGVENWGGNLHFPKYGDMKKAHFGTDRYPVKILLSHDPSHWNMQVSKEYKTVDLTFSGHTHGFQFGIEIPGFKWSPSQYLYKQWAGLYKENNQHIYVNRGLGFLGYPGRVGIMPEITVMELYNT